MARTVTIEKGQGAWGTKFKADVKIAKCSVELVQGYVDGSTGANVTLGGHSLGVGIGDPKFWAVPVDKPCNKECPEGKTAFKKCIEVKVNFNLIYVLIFNSRDTKTIGTVCADECCCHTEE